MVLFSKKYLPGASGVSVILFSQYPVPQTFCIAFDCLKELGSGTDLPVLIETYMPPASTRIITKNTITLSCVWQRNTDTFSVHDEGLTINSPGMEPLNTPLPLEKLFYTDSFLTSFGKISDVYRNLANE